MAKTITIGELLTHPHLEQTRPVFYVELQTWERPYEFVTIKGTKLDDVVRHAASEYPGEVWNIVNVRRLG